MIQRGIPHDAVGETSKDPRQGFLQEILELSEMDPDKVQGDLQKMLAASTFLEMMPHHSSSWGVGCKEVVERKRE